MARAQASARADSLDGGSGRGPALVPELTPTPAVALDKALGRELALLSANADTHAVLRAAGIGDAAALRRLGQQLIRMAEANAPPRPDDVDLAALSQKVPDRALADVIAGAAGCFPHATAAALTDPGVALSVARGTPVEAAVRAARLARPAASGTPADGAQAALSEAKKLSVSGQGKAALDLLVRSAAEFGKSPEFRSVAAQIAALAADGLPDGAPKRLLAHGELIAALLEPETVGDFRALLRGELAAPLQRLLSNDALRDGALDVVCGTPAVAQLLERAGLSAELLKGAGAAAPALFAAADALRRKDYPAALESFRQATLTGATALVVDLVARMVATFPAGVARSVLSDRTVLNLVLTDQAAHSAVAALFSPGDDHLQAFGALLKADLLRDAALGAAAQDPGVTERLAGLGLRPDDLVGAGRAAGFLFDAALEAARLNVGATLEALKNALAEAPGITNRLVDVAIDHLPDAALAPLTSLGVTRDDLKQGKFVAVTLWGIAQRLRQHPPDVEGSVQALVSVADQAPQVAGKLAKVAFDLLPTGLLRQLDALGITVTELRESLPAAPALIRAARAFGQGQPKEGLVALRDAASLAPSLVEHAVLTLAQKVPPGVGREVLMDPVLVRTLLTDASLHGALADLLSGTVEGTRRALVTLGDDGAARTAIANSLWKRDGLRADFEKLGFLSADDLAGAGRAFSSAISLYEEVAAGRYGDAIQALGRLTEDLPDGVVARVSAALTTTLHLPPGVSDVLLQGGFVISDPEIRTEFAAAVDAWKAGQTRGYIKSLGRVGELLADKHPAGATAFMNLLGNLPGGIGRFFGDPVLNDGLVRSGAVTEVFQAVQKLSDSDLHGAFKDLAESVGHLIGQGERYRVAGRELPVGKEGVELMARLGKQFVSALPSSVRLRIETRAAELAARAGGAAIPGGSLIAAASDGYDVYKELKRPTIDWVAVGLKSSELALDLAGTVGLGPLIAPARLLVGAVDTLHDAKRLVEDLDAFRRDFTFGTTSPEPAASGGPAPP